MKVQIFLLLILGVPILAAAAAHGPVFGLATPTNSQGEWSFDQGLFGRASSAGSQTSIRELIAYGLTPHLMLSATLPAAFGSGRLAPTRIQAGADFDASLAWRFQHKATKVGTRFETTAIAGLAVPGPQSGFPYISKITNSPGTMLGLVTGTASLSNYLWLGGTYTKFYERNGVKRPDVLDYSLVYGYRPPKWRRSADKWDWRLFAELVGEHSQRFRLAAPGGARTQAHQVFLGPSALGIYHNYTVSFGAQVPVFQDVGAVFSKERVRFAINFSYLLFQHSH